MSLHKEEYTLKIKRMDEISLDKNYDMIKFYKDSVWQQPQMNCALKMYTLFLSLGIFNSSYSLPVFKKQCICTYRWVTHILPTQVRHRQPNKNNHLLKTWKMAIVCLIIKALKTITFHRLLSSAQITAECEWRKSQNQIACIWFYFSYLIFSQKW